MKDGARGLKDKSPPTNRGTTAYDKMEKSKKEGYACKLIACCCAFFPLTLICKSRYGSFALPPNVLPKWFLEPSQLKLPHTLLSWSLIGKSESFLSQKVSSIAVLVQVQKMLGLAAFQILSLLDRNIPTPLLPSLRGKTVTCLSLS